MTAHRITASRLDLLAVCAGAARLPWTRDTSQAGDAGTRRHAFVQRAVEGDYEGAVELLREDLRARMLKVDLEALFERFPNPRAEVAVAYDPDTDSARELATNGHRDYSDVRANEIAGTIDLLSVLPDSVVVGDLKTGASFATHARDSRQVQFAALASSRLFAKPRATGSVLKVEEDGSIRPLTAEWDELDLDAIAHDMKRIRDEVAKPDAPLVVSDACRWCPARTHCPEMAAQAQALVEIGKRSQGMTDDVLVSAYRAWKVVKPLGEKIEEQVRARCMESPLPASEGKSLRLVESVRRTPKLAAAVGLAADCGVDPKAVIAAGTLSRANLVKHVGEEQADRLLAAIESEHGMSETHTLSLREVKDR